MSYLAQLLSRPNHEIHALELVAPGEAVNAGETPVVDARAKDNYRKRFNELKSELDQAERNNDQANITRLSEELEWLRRQLSEAFGLGGRPRATGSAAERARVSTTRAIRKALQRIQEVHPSLGEHLHRNLRTGQFCCYDPDRELQMTWRL
jgi:5'-deoxynucleotidase YfbR-like HD superfamily hydrolase